MVIVLMLVSLWALAWALQDFLICHALDVHDAMMKELETVETILTASAMDTRAQRRVLSYVDNERTAGRIAVWRSVSDSDQAVSARQNVQDTLSSVGQTQASDGSFAQALVAENGESAAGQADSSSAPEPFGFGDFLDMVNPLQHIPLVNSLYRAATGDTIKPISKMVGGVIFGGPLGAVMPLVEVVAQQEMGSAATQNAFDPVSAVQSGGLSSASQEDALALVSFADLASSSAVTGEDLEKVTHYLHETRHYND
jgi:hypothetical protein